MRRVSVRFRALQWCVLVLIPFGFMTGCAAIQKALGLKTDLKDEKITSIRAELKPGAALCPGGSGTVVVTVTLEDGTVLWSENAPDGKILLKALQVGLEYGSVKGAEVQLDPDPRATYGKQIHLRVAPVHHPDKIADLVVPITYACNYYAKFNGIYGEAGTEGTRGTDGVRGSEGRMANAPDPGTPGGAGGSGTGGGQGGPGQAGGRGDDVEVRVAVLPGSPRAQPLLQVRVTSVSRRSSRDFLMDTAGGQLNVQARGGDGGEGGAGGWGGHGGPGGGGSPRGNGGGAGDGGLGGDGGTGGDGGSITVYVPAEAKQWLSLIKLDNGGGFGGRAGHGGPGGNGGDGEHTGPSGRVGGIGRDGYNGRPGPTPVIKVQESKPLW